MPHLTCVASNFNRNHSSFRCRKDTLSDPKETLWHNCDTVIPFIRKTVEFESGDFEIGTLSSFKERQRRMAFGYENPEHDECRVVGFRIKGKRLDKIRRDDS